MMIFEAIKTLFGGIDKRSNIVIKIQTHLIMQSQNYDSYSLAKHYFEHKLSPG